MKLRVTTFNVHHCEGADGVVEHSRAAEVLTQAEPDVVALQELDRNLARSGKVDQPTEIARMLGMELRFFPTLEHGDGHYGIAIAARGVGEARFVPLPRVRGEEPRGAIIAVCSGVNFVATHLSTDRRARPVQLAALGAIAAGLEGPTVVMGDLNAAARSLGSLARLGLAGAFGHSTLPGRIPRRQIDHILVSRELAIVRSWTIPSKASDHFPLCAELELRPA
jgi:endonuclease/exonuclease/phosphatase family metal-dependent hydrolase